jgi:hypothetical protein
MFAFNFRDVRRIASCGRAHALSVVHTAHEPSQMLRDDLSYTRTIGPWSYRIVSAPVQRTIFYAAAAGSM